MLLKIYQTGHPILRQQAQAVTKEQLASAETQHLIDWMIETLRDIPGVGLAAPQVGQSLQIFVVEDKATYHKKLPEAVLKERDRKAVSLKVLVNPRLETLEADQNLYFEGCLSVESYVAAVPRSNKVKVSGWDRTGKPVTYTATGWFARILQHEIGHLRGELHIDHMKPKSLISFKNFTEQWFETPQATIRHEFDR